MDKPRIALALCALLLAATAAAFPAHPENAFSLDLSPLHRVATGSTLQAGTYATADPSGSHRHTQIAHHHTL